MSDENVEVDVDDDEDCEVEPAGFDWRGLGQAVYWSFFGVAMVLVLGHDYIIQIIHAVQGR